MTIAGSDSVGGAGIEADVKAMASVGVHACAVVTAVTAQNTASVERIFPVPPDMIQAQIDAVLKDVDVKAIKTGMLYDAEIVGVVADALEDHDMPLIIDPVMVAGVGGGLARDDLPTAIRRKLMPLCELITPNRHEAEVLAGMKIRNDDDAKLACELIGKEGSSVLLKGGHMTGRTVVDFLYLSSEFTRFEYPRLERAGHGGGCTLSAYIAAHMAKSIDIVNSVILSRNLIQESIAAMYAIGRGDKCVNPMVKMQDDSAKFRVLDDVDSAADKLADLLPRELIPSAGMNIAYAMQNAAGPEDVAAVERRITFHNGRTRKNGKAKFGSAEQASFLILSAMKYDPEARASVNLEYSAQTIDVMEEVGLDIEVFDRRKHRDLGLGEIAEQTIRAAGRVPDVFIDKGTGRNDRGIRILGKSPEDILEKIELIL